MSNEDLRMRDGSTCDCSAPTSMQWKSVATRRVFTSSVGLLQSPTGAKKQNKNQRLQERKYRGYWVPKNQKYALEVRKAEVESKLGFTPQM